MAAALRTPASMRIRAAVRTALHTFAASPRRESTAHDDAEPQNETTRQRPPLVLAALSGGADSLALAAALAVEAPRAGLCCGAIIVDHGLQRHAAAVAERAAGQARSLGLNPVIVRRVTVSLAAGSVTGGVEAAARTARYAVFAEAAARCEAAWVCTAHTRDDQAEQVLLALLRGSGTRSIAGIPPCRSLACGARVVRPLLDERAGVTRAVTVASCAELGLEPWVDPHNSDPSYARVRVRTEVLPMLRQQLGAGIVSALARSADIAREDADALDELAQLRLNELLDRAATLPHSALPVRELSNVPAALLARVIRRFVADHFGTWIGREQTRAVMRLVTDWHGQGPIAVAGGLVHRTDGLLRLSPHSADAECL